MPILQGKSRWGSLEVAFRPLGTPGWPSWLDPAEWRLVIYITAANALIYLFYLGRVLYALDPSRVMPQRVRAAFDTLTEGLLVLDNEGRIVMANQAFALVVGRKPTDLLGTKASILPFLDQAWTREEIPRRVFSVQAHLQGGAVESDITLLEAQRLAASDA